MIAHIYIEIAEKSQKETEKTFGYVMECEGHTATREGFGKVKATYHRAVLLAMIDAMKRFKKACEIHIHVDDSFVTAALDGKLYEWRESGYKKLTGEMIANAEEWSWIGNMSEENMLIPEPGKHQYTNWIREEMAKR